MEVERTRHAAYNIIYHLVWCPKYRRKVLTGPVARRLDQLIRFKVAELKGQVVALEAQPDHVHLVLSIPPKYAVSNVMGYLKGKLAIRLFERYERFGRRYWGRHLWARGYWVSTIGLDEEKIRKYVKWQEKREKQLEAIQGELFD